MTDEVTLKQCNIPVVPELLVHVAFANAQAREIYDDAKTGEPVFPIYATPDSAGADLRACLSSPSVSIPPGERLFIASGIRIQIQSGGWAAFLYSRSGLGAKQGLVVAQGVGVIDQDFTGEILACMLNTSSRPIAIERGDRIAQLVFQPFARARWQEVTEFCATSRGDGAFGHSGLE